MTSGRFDFLLRQYIANALTETEWEEFAEAISEGGFDERMSLDFMSSLHEGKTHPEWSKPIESSMWKRIQERARISDTSVIQIHKSGKRFWLAAASVILLLYAGSHFYFRPEAQKPIYPVAKIPDPNFKNDVLPGTNKAVLTLADGKTIILDSTTMGLLAEQGGSQVKNQNGGLEYIRNVNSSGTVFNTLITNRGQQFPLTLSDGTRVWLNASSSIHYPVAFNSGDRSVEMTGEAYFEVKYSPAHPFHVKVQAMEVQDLGTHFNINAYANEGSMKTTLLEGSVSINGNNIMKPGQEAVFENANDIRIINSPDAEGAIAWKNGQFHFTKADITTVMRQIERWYDLKVVYKGSKTTDKFMGDIPRTATLTELLSILQMAKVHFKLEGNTLTVLP
jgi:transmembrane sensor